MISFPPAKINLGLSVVSKRPDGFHNLETIFYPLPLRDALEISTGTEIRIIQSGAFIPGVVTDNLVFRAYQLLKKKHPSISPLQIYLHKAIPTGAGLGGGSSDAAAMLRLVSRFFALPVSPEELFGYALQLGSDCPFFLQSAPCFASGRGEILEPLSLDLSTHSILLIHPEIHVDTSWAYSSVKPAPSGYDLRETVSQPVKYWNKTIRNDFENPVFARFPALEKIKEKLYAAGALFASMTGSGSTIFGIFEKNEVPELFVENAGQTVIR